MISDFGLTRFSDTDVLTQCGTFHFIAPEVTSDRRAGGGAIVCDSGWLAVLRSCEGKHTVRRWTFSALAC
jgi:serine/threonine protein kinase